MLRLEALKARNRDGDALLQIGPIEGFKNLARQCVQHYEPTMGETSRFEILSLDPPIGPWVRVPW